jgi:hypothetical protein
MDACDFPAQLQLLGQVAGILEHPMREAHVLRHQGVVVENQRPPLSGQTIEYAIDHGGPYALLHEAFELSDALFHHLLKGVTARLLL